MRLLFTGEGVATFTFEEALAKPSFPDRETLEQLWRLHNRRFRAARPLQNRRSRAGGNPGAGFLSYEIDAHPPHLFPGHEFAAHDLYVAPGPLTKYGSEAV